MSSSTLLTQGVFLLPSHLGLSNKRRLLFSNVVEDTLARPIKSAAQQVRAFALWKLGMSVSAIQKQIETEFEEPVSRSSVGNWTKGFQNVAPQQPDQDEPFKWSRMGEFGIPWEHSAMLTAVAKLSRDDQAYPSPLTMRQAKWFSRLMTVFLTTGPGMVERHFQPDFIGVWWLLSLLLARGEQGRELLGFAVDISPIEDYLGYQPWLDDEHRRDYLQALKRGSVQPVCDADAGIIPGMYQVEDALKQGGQLQDRSRTVGEAEARTSLAVLERFCLLGPSLQLEPSTATPRSAKGKNTTTVQNRKE